MNDGSTRTRGRTQWMRKKWSIHYTQTKTVSQSVKSGSSHPVRTCPLSAQHQQRTPTNERTTGPGQDSGKVFPDVTVYTILRWSEAGIVSPPFLLMQIKIAKDCQSDVNLHCTSHDTSWTDESRKLKLHSSCRNPLNLTRVVTSCVYFKKSR